ncbi:MAG: hypothetical protein HC765_05335 [Brachymonas sp.]|nr:hypothetical protein [Brachymonas sp.]
MPKAALSHAQSRSNNFRHVFPVTTHTHQLIQALRAALSEKFPAQTAWTQAHLEPLKAKGLAHDHIRLAGTGLLARIPKQSQMQLPALENLQYQQACFHRASAAGFAPQCLRIITPCARLPRGALMVQEILGRAAQLPQDLALMASSMAALHRINLPPEASRAPLLNAPDPLQAMWDEVSAQAAFLPQADLAPSVAARFKQSWRGFKRCAWAALALCAA